MKITNVSIQAKNPNRVNVSIDGKYRFSLDIFQMTELRIKQGREISEDEVAGLEQESVFGKLYARALEYTMLRPHSAREIRDYLWRKTRATQYRSKKTGEIKEREGVSKAIADRVFERLQNKGYINDESFARYWVENRNQTKGTSKRKLQSELQAKGIERRIIDDALSSTERNDTEELTKIIAKKRSKYPDRQKLMAYLARQGFSFDDIKSALDADDYEED